MTPQDARAIAHLRKTIGSVKLLAREDLGQFRRTRLWTQRELAERAGLNPQHYNQVELGRRAVTMATAEAISKALGVRLRTAIEKGWFDFA